MHDAVLAGQAPLVRLLSEAGADKHKRDAPRAVESKSASCQSFIRVSGILGGAELGFGSCGVVPLPYRCPYIYIYIYIGRDGNVEKT